MALASPSPDAEPAVGAGHETGSPEELAFMPRLFVLTTLPHRRPQGNRFERVNGWQSLRMEAPRRVGLPFGVYPRLLLMLITTKAVRKKSRQIHLGATPNDLAQKLGVPVVSGPRGTAQRLQAQVRKLALTTWSWQSTEPSSHSALTHRSAPTVSPSLHTLAVSLGLSEAKWRSSLLLHEDFFSEITRSAVPIDLRAIHQLKSSPLALDLYSWLTHRMSYLRRPCLIPWNALHSQIGSDFGRTRDFKRSVLSHLEDVVRVYPKIRLTSSTSGLLLRPSATHVRRTRSRFSG